MSEIKLVAETRTEFGKGAARRIRRADKIPAVLYGHGTDPVHITLPGHETMLALKAANALLTIELDGKEPAGAGQGRPARPDQAVIEHVDLVIVRRGEKVTVDVPVHLDRRGRARDRRHRRDPAPSQLEAEATHIPENVEVSVEGLEAGTQIHAPATWCCPRAPTLVTDPETAGRQRHRGASTAEALEAELAEAEAEAGIEHEAPRGRDRGCRGARRGRRGHRRGLSRPPPRRARRPSAHAEPMASDRPPGSSSGWATPARRTPATGTTSAPWSSTSWPPAPVRALARAQGAGSRAEVRLGVLPGGAPGPRGGARAGRCRYMNESGGPVAGADAASTSRPSSDWSSSTTSSTSPSPRCGSSAAAARAATTGCARSASRSAPGLPPGAGRHRPPARPDGPGRLRAARTSPPTERKELPFLLVGRRRRRRARSSPRASRPRSSTSIRANFL